MVGCGVIPRPAVTAVTTGGDRGAVRTVLAVGAAGTASGAGAKLSAIAAAAWPGNLRELRNAVEEVTRPLLIEAGKLRKVEAARVAALCGHSVTLFEARESLGGALALWAALPGREKR